MTLMSVNRSHRVIDPAPSPSLISSTSRTIDSTLLYRGSQLPTDSLRLLAIKPATHDDDPVVCTLKAVPFGDRPKFEALSYMWGPEDGNDAITLNGFAFRVRRNLLDALRFLRRYDTSRREATKEGSPCMYWIDAICINQDDTAERNRQLPIIGQIYFRASTVVEIGQARHLRVCFGDHPPKQWEEFAQLINLHYGDRSTGPLRLDRLLRKEKYNNSHTLKRLLEDHQEAESSDRKDKVYRLVGLAHDAAGFPMDYNKSLYDVWKDTIVFMNERELFKPEHED
ncbi:hypothetical protein N658DRAFT_511392 [Parathielavia hyrcaniae]|uniref:Heterokaryon incompatibility domain-containing protein n=1 Tax=Parathielavia hyrcaniae TaxID=113614 RepID=A0AAN6PR66_9PEZI|nr:hypothetical protein N658DRAFT_511392 [Parathielavia hyrcaniae]